MLWRHDTGRVTDWFGTVQGGFVANDAVMMPVPVQWHVESPDTILL